MTTEPLDSPESLEPAWQRVSPVSVLDTVVVAIRQGAIQALPALVVLFASAASSDNLEAAWLARGVVALMLIGLGWAFLSYLRFGFRLRGDHIEVRSGVLHRQVLDVDFDRIQNVSVKEPFYLRPFGMAALGIDTAGSSGKEIRLPGLRLAEARRLRQRLVSAVDEASARGGHEAAAVDRVEDDGAAVGEVLVQLTRKDVVIAGLTANFMVWAAVALGSVFGSEQTTERLFPWVMEQLRLDMFIDEVRAEGGNLLLGLITTGLTLLLLLLLPLISVIGALFRYDGYTLGVDGDRFRRTSGMLSKHDDSVRQHKIQGVTWKQNAIARLFGRINLSLRQASAGEGVEQVSGGSAGPAFTVPSLRPEEAGELTGRFLPGFTPFRETMTRVDRRRYLLVTSAVPVLAPLPMLLVLSIGVDARIALIWLPIVLLTLLITHRCWRQTGWAVDGDHAMFRKGFIGSTTTVFPLFKLQRVDLVQTPMQRKRGLASLTVHMASHSMTMPWMRVEDARDLRDLALYRAEVSDEPWF